MTCREGGSKMVYQITWNKFKAARNQQNEKTEKKSILIITSLNDIQEVKRKKKNYKSTHREKELNLLQWMFKWHVRCYSNIKMLLSSNAKLYLVLYVLCSVLFVVVVALACMYLPEKKKLFNTVHFNMKTTVINSFFFL